MIEIQHIFLIVSFHILYSYLEVLRGDIVKNTNVDKTNLFIQATG